MARRFGLATHPSTLRGNADSITNFYRPGKKNPDGMRLYGHGFAVLAPDAAQPITDFPDSRIGLDAIEDSRQNIFSAARSFFQPYQRGLYSDRVATLAQSPQALDLGFLN